MLNSNIDSLNEDLANLRLGGRGEVDRNNEPFKSVIRRHHRARDITDEFSQAVKGEFAVIAWICG